MDGWLDVGYRMIAKASKMFLKPVVWPHVEKALAPEDVRGRPPTWAI